MWYFDSHIRVRSEFVQHSRSALNCQCTCPPSRHFDSEMNNFLIKNSNIYHRSAYSRYTTWIVTSRARASRWFNLTTRWPIMKFSLIKFKFFWLFFYIFLLNLISNTKHKNMWHIGRRKSEEIIKKWYRKMEKMGAQKWGKGTNL